MDNTSIADNINSFLPEYPNINSDTFSYDLAKRKEFQDNVLESEEHYQGEALKHQKLEATYISPSTTYQNMVMVHGTGTGKTCLASLIVENFKHTLVDNRPRKPAIILVPNNTLLENFVKEVYEICTNNIYFSSEKDANPKKLISKTYQIMKYIEFSNKISTTSDEDIKKIYSDRVFILDEVHNV